MPPSRRHLDHHWFLMRPQLNAGTMGGQKTVSLSTLLFGVLLPQLAGVAALRVFRKRVVLAAFLVPLVSAAAFFVPTWHEFSVASARIESETGDAPCGAFGAMILFVSFGGAGLHLLASLGEVMLFASFQAFRRRRLQATTPA